MFLIFYHNQLFVYNSYLCCRELAHRFFSNIVNVARELYIISKRTISSPAPAANNESSEAYDIIKPGRNVKI